MNKNKFLYAIFILILGFLIVVLLRDLTENNKSVISQIEGALAGYDAQFSKTITIQFNNNKIYGFYETNNSTLKVVLLRNDLIKRIVVDKLISEYPIIPDQKVSWQGVGDPPSETYLLYGVIYEPNITQMFLESEENKTVNIVKVDEDKSIWFRFLDARVTTPVIINATDKNGNELYYYGPERRDSY